MPGPARILRVLRILALAAAAPLLAGCASTYLLDNQVQSFSQLPGMPVQPTYRFERTLSQQVDPAQPALEGLADPALYAAGLRRDDAHPNYSVQVSAQSQPILSPYVDPYWGPWGWGGGWRAGYGGPHGSVAFGGPWWPPGPDAYWFRREVSVILRELPGGRVVYESHAVNEGPLLDNRAVLPAMFQAAMSGFPTPPPGPRQVDIQLGGHP